MNAGSKVNHSSPRNAHTHGGEVDNSQMDVSHESVSSFQRKEKYRVNSANQCITFFYAPKTVYTHIGWYANEELVKVTTEFVWLLPGYAKMDSFHGKLRLYMSRLHHVPH